MKAQPAHDEPAGPPLAARRLVVARRAAAPRHGPWLDLLGERRVATRGPQRFGGPMSGIYMILVFLAVLAALNKFEFGRFD